MNAVNAIAITPGEPAGIGPDITLQLAQYALPALPVAIADKHLLQARAAMLNLDIELVDFDPTNINPHQPGRLTVLHMPLAVPVEVGVLNPQNADYVLSTITQAVAACQNKTCHAITTGPIQKSVINDAGIAFTGHTELLGELTNSQAVMMLASKTLRIALATTHLPLQQVSAAITQDSLKQVLLTLHKDLQNKFGIAQPRIAVAGLNPHAGESGHLGREEIEVIAPLIESLQQQGFLINGPLSADTIYTPAVTEQHDAILAMYHDQGLPVIKYASFGEAINITLGLPIIRTSVDHGTALALAGTGQANASSLKEAFEIASQMHSPLPKCAAQQ